MERYEQDPVDRKIDNTYVETSSDSGVTWFIVGALVIAAGVLAYLYFGDDAANSTAETAPPAIEAPADTGRASTPAAPAEPAAPVEPAPAPMAPPAAPPAP
ncbi:hypothetical protein IZ6_09340 [Terrihabitans soli]|uniref:Uncharacterized protein n=1 Tax=Terrihabitans soli TaxID=708113 RepID=A0A6S6QMN6_9HYPH|nr:hypothetical protein [Terrihabitans soli]BCJ90199.1 hypothetical protein IZ6_09340 [Terrihabitans soli]